MIKNLQIKITQMRTISYLFIISIFNLSCESKINNYYAGFVVDELGHPVADVTIKEISHPDETRTNKNGFLN